MEELNKEGTVQIKESEELDLFLKYLHETGTIIYFSIKVLRDNIVLDSKWLIDALKLLINAHPNLQNSQADNGLQSNSPAENDADNGLQSNSPAENDADNGLQSNSPAENDADNGLQSNNPAENDADNGLQSNSPAENDADNGLQSNSPADIAVTHKWSDFKNKGILSPELVGQRLSSCMLHINKFNRRLVAACITRWPVAKKKVTSENLIFCGSCVFDIDLFHRLTLHFRNHIIFARITRMVTDEVKTLDARLSSRVRKFITLNLSKITSYLGENLQYELLSQCPLSQCVPEDGLVYLSPPFDMWFADEGHDPNIPITPEHMNHARLCVALVTVCGNAMREVLCTHVPTGHTNIYQAILATKGKLTGKQRRPLLNPDQIPLVYPDPHGQRTGILDQFDLSLLYTLIRNVSTVPTPITGWGKDPQDQPRDTSLGASVERVRSYMNNISGHYPDVKVSRQDLEDYWNKFVAVLHDIEAIIGGQLYSQKLQEQKRHVISIYEAC